MQVQPADAWLRDESDDCVYLADQAGHFDLSSLTLYSTLVMESLTTASTARAIMSSLQPSTPRVGQSFSSAQGSSSVTPGNTPPYFCSMIAAKKQPVHLVKIMKAKMTAGKRKGSKPSLGRLA